MSDDRAAALEGFVTLVQGSKGKACQMVIAQTLRTQNIYVFGELLSEPNVQELDSQPELRPWLDLLKIFAYGTYSDYKANASAKKLPEMKDVMLTKLKMLTIVTHASQNKIVPYELLLKELDLTNVRELEDLIIECIYQGLIKGKLDQKRSALEVHATIGRDISPEDINAILKKLAAWSDASQVLIDQLDKRITMANESKVQEKRDEEELQSDKKSAIEAIRVAKEQEAQAGVAMMGGGPMGSLMSNMAGLMGIDTGGGGGDRGRPGKRRGPDPRGRQGGGGMMGMFGMGGQRR